MPSVRKGSKFCQFISGEKKPERLFQALEMLRTQAQFPLWSRYRDWLNGGRKTPPSPTDFDLEDKKAKRQMKKLLSELDLPPLNFSKGKLRPALKPKSGYWLNIRKAGKDPKPIHSVLLALSKKLEVNLSEDGPEEMPVGFNVFLTHLARGILPLDFKYFPNFKVSRHSRGNNFLISLAKSTSRGVISSSSFGLPTGVTDQEGLERVESNEQLMKFFGRGHIIFHLRNRQTKKPLLRLTLFLKGGGSHFLFRLPRRFFR